jgi:hypothetical protein
VSGENALNISGGENSKIVLGEGGINIERSDDAITSLEHIIDVPLDISYVPQSWILDATNTTLSIKKSISSLNSVLPILIDSKEKGGIGFYEDNLNLTVPLVFTNLTVYMPPRVYHPNGLGSPSREVTFSGSHPNFMNATWGKPFTNYVPLRISSNNTTAKPGRYLQESGRTDCILYLAGPVTFYSVVTSQKNLYSRGHLHFLGGIIDDNSRELCFRMEGGDNWIEDKPINFSSPLTIDYESVLNIAATNNVWSTLHYYAAKIKCQNENVLAVDGEMKAGHGHNVYFRVPGGSLDLNGYNQKVKRFYIGWNPASTSTNSKGVPYYTGYTVVTSAVPASLQITGDASDVISVDFQGVAGLNYNGTGVLTLTNHTQTTLGELKVSQGRVNLSSGSGWIATTNVVVEGGILSVGKEVGARAFGQEQDASRANLWFSGSGVLDIAEGERATVLTLTKINEDGTLKYCTPGVYGGADCAVAGVIKNDNITGAGVLYVRSTLKPSTLLIIK